MCTVSTSNDDIQRKIDIVYKALTIYNEFLDADMSGNEELIIDIKQKIKNEEKNLQKLKDKHTEFFI
jgi:hypothetical protein